MTDERSGGDRSQSPWPKHHQVYRILLQQIREGGFAPDGAMPNENEIARRFAVSRITVRRALERLEREGVVERHQGRGTFARGAPVESPVQASLSGSIENLVAMGLETEVTVLSLRYAPASREVAQALELDEGDAVQEAVRVRSLRGTPFSHLVTYVPERLGRSYGEEDLRAHPLLVLLERAGARVARARQFITATLAAPEIARLLRVEVGAPLLSIRRVVCDERDAPVEYIRGLYRPDTYEHEVTYERRRAAEGALWQSAATAS
jgi:GntR family transcriptional regulator